MITKHERSLMRVARHWSLCRDDALDAYQRALEIYVRRLDSLDPTTELAWLKVVVKHEALAIRRQHGESFPVDAFDLDSQPSETQRPLDELLAGRERVKRSAEVLRRLKPDEAKALMLRAQGLSYQEIAERLSWTYTKVNRSITEGRARFLRVYAEIEAGAECERFAPTLAALVAGTATAEALLELRPHIRNCPSCRATVRDLQATRLGRLRALWPVPALVVPLRWATRRLRQRDREATPEPDRFADAATDDRIHRAIAEAPGPPVDNARPRVVEWALQRTGDGVASAKQHAAAAYARAADPTPLAGVRPGAAVAAVAGCLAVGGGTTLCMTQGVDPIGGLAHVVSPAREQQRDEPRKQRAPRKRAAATATPSPTPAPAATPLVTAAPAPVQQPPAQSRPQPTPTPTPAPAPAPEDEYEPVAPAATAATAPTAPPPPSRTPAPAAAAGPGEFDGP